MKRYDNRIVGDLCSDLGVRITAGGLLNDPVLLAMLDDASGEIDAACFVGERYRAVQLLLLTGQDQAFLFRLTADLAYGLLRLRRGLSIEGFPQIADALAMLDALRRGQRVFAVPANELAGIPADEFPALAKYANWNLMRDAARRIFNNRRFQTV